MCDRTGGAEDRNSVDADSRARDRGHRSGACRSLHAAKVGDRGRYLLHQHEVPLVELARRIADDVNDMTFFPQRGCRALGKALESAVQMRVDSREQYSHDFLPAWKPRYRVRAPTMTAVARTPGTCSSNRFSHAVRGGQSMARSQSACPTKAARSSDLSGSLKLGVAR